MEALTLECHMVGLSADIMVRNFKLETLPNALVDSIN